MDADRESRFRILHEYMDAAIQSSNRSRGVLLVMITASVLAFAAYWNSRPDNWIQGRIACADRVIDILSHAQQPQKIILDEPLGWLFRVAGLDQSTSRDNECANQTRPSSDSAACECMQHYHLIDLVSARSFRAKLISQWADNDLLVKVPFFGFSFDVNDLGFIGGLTFSIILLWFRFAVAQELHNLRRVFDFFAADRPTGPGGNDDLEMRKFAYRAMSMRQVLTIPPSLTTESTGDISWPVLAMSLFLLPLLVHLMIFARDLGTQSVGFAINSSDTVLALCASSAFLIFVAFMTLQVIRLNLWINRAWRQEADFLKDSQDHIPASHDRENTG